MKKACFLLIVVCFFGCESGNEKEHYVKFLSNYESALSVLKSNESILNSCDTQDQCLFRLELKDVERYSANHEGFLDVKELWNLDLVIKDGVSIYGWKSGAIQFLAVVEPGITKSVVFDTTGYLSSFGGMDDFSAEKIDQNWYYLSEYRNQ